MRGGMDVRAPLSWPLASVTMAHLMRMFYTGAEMKLARSFTLAMFKRNFMNHWVYWVGSMICDAMGAVMYDLMLFPSICGLAKRVATLNGSRPLEQDTGGEPIKLKAQSLYRNPATKPVDVRARQNCYSRQLLPTTQLFSQQTSSPPSPSNPALLLPATQLSSSSQQPSSPSPPSNPALLLLPATQLSFSSQQPSSPSPPSNPALLLLPATQLFSSQQPSSSPPSNPALLLPATQLFSSQQRNSPPSPCNAALLPLPATQLSSSQQSSSPPPTPTPRPTQLSSLQSSSPPPTPTPRPTQLSSSHNPRPVTNNQQPQQSD
ncbi:uncharacterized protein LOC134454758 [Engraulis encrasicolus]|uniref:uncharacterized protein LOC134454758 n=1 Tax=Engraulis encrasicolus TaxID=184585 RepID=UPI002FD47C03